MSVDDMDDVVGRALRALLPPRAPRPLLPRVLAAVQAPPVRPWYEQGWFAWPRRWQIAAMGVLGLLAFAGLVMLPALLGAEPVLAAAHAVVGELLTSIDYVKMASDTGGIVARSLRPLLAPLAMVVVFMLAACAVFGAALNHVLLGRTSEL